MLKSQGVYPLWGVKQVGKQAIFELNASLSLASAAF